MAEISVISNVNVPASVGAEVKGHTSLRAGERDGGSAGGDPARFTDRTPRSSPPQLLLVQERSGDTRTSLLVKCIISHEQHYPCFVALAIEIN